jgi:ABC-2 type transport system permease protein
MKRLIWYFEFVNIVFKMNIKATISYFGWNVITENVVNMAVYAFQYLLIWATMRMFNTMNGWSLYEVTFIYSVNLLSYALGNVFIRPFWNFDNLIIRGGLDDYLVRPVNPLFHLLTREWQFNYLGHFIIGTAVMKVVMGKMSIIWTSYKIILLFIMIIGGALIQAAITVIPSCAAFWTNRSQNIARMVRGFRDVINYPISIYPRFIGLILTFVMPYAWVNYYPALTMLGKDTNSLMNIMPYITLIIGVGLTLVSYIIWNLGLRSYNSSGS